MTCADEFTWDYFGSRVTADRGSATFVDDRRLT
jgi:hypothetical protein